MHDPGTITRAVNGLVRGAVPTEAEPAVRQIYDELRRLAASKLARDPGASCPPTELVHDAFLKLFRPSQTPWDSRAHFFGAAGRAMQQLLIEQYRRRRLEPGSADDLDQVAARPGVDPERLSRALNELSRHDARMAEIVYLRNFAGLTVPDAADVLGISERHLKRNYAFALAWLYRRMSDERPGDDVRRGVGKEGEGS